MKRVLLSVFLSALVVLSSCEEDTGTYKVMSQNSAEPQFSASTSDRDDVIEEIAELGYDDATEEKYSSNTEENARVVVSHAFHDDITNGNKPKVYAATASTEKAKAKQSASPPQKYQVSVGSIEFETTNAAVHADSIRSLVFAQGGYLEKDKEQRNDYRVTHKMTIRVPVHRYQTLYREIQMLDIILIKQESDVLDVSGTFRDLSQRIASELAVEKEYRKLLNRAANMSDIIELTGKLNHVRSKIEAMQGNKNKLEERIAWSTIVVDFHQEIEPDEIPSTEESFFAELGSAFGTGWQGIHSFVLAMISVWPLLIVVVAALFILRRRSTSAHPSSTGAVEKETA